MQLEKLPQRKNRKYSAKRIGRGYGSGVGGHTVGRGTKGQKSRSGHKSTVFFEGGNRPFFSRIPKFKGFKSKAERYQPVNLNIIEEEYKTSEVVNLESLKEKKLVKKTTKLVKVLGVGELTKKISFEGLAVSASAKTKIEKAGGSIK
ncbi:MAG: 50S ribosomal protein L15 [candidate division WS6 bacterium GW2011_GWF2_39_15]|uniref:Large ribosomal subunit protein uL15 n=1 Tax=candidate division WS6 bacterium GW2011_GWF2_39_15 TaxID=1619100 RepID=A0A0G0MR99_9BACT|nr:MAG: 50S ribosomal protein L15 [candidate division WS6 bacterium GW2011_GWF2_39_15]